MNRKHKTWFYKQLPYDKQENNFFFCNKKQSFAHTARSNNLYMTSFKYCHLNALGNETHADLLTSSMLQSLSLQSVSSNCTSRSEGRGLALFRLEARVGGLGVISPSANSDPGKGGLGGIGVQVLCNFTSDSLV